jgi:glutamate--cysteine ligase
MTTAFPEVRLKRFLEMRGSDGGPWRRLCALPAFWAGLFYEQSSLDAAWDVVKDWTQADRDKLRLDVTTMGLKAKVAGRSLQNVALQVLEISAAGLRARNKQDYLGRDETIFLDTLNEIARSGLTPADTMLAEYEGRWGRSVDPAYRDYAY